MWRVFTLCPLFHDLGVPPDGPPSTEDQCSPNPCQNSAICRARGDGYSCFCVPGFQGAHCQIDVNECASEPCRNGATCEDRVGNFSCLCPPGFTGEWTELCLGIFSWSSSLKEKIKDCFWVQLLLCDVCHWHMKRHNGGGRVWQN